MIDSKEVSWRRAAPLAVVRASPYALKLDGNTPSGLIASMYVVGLGKHEQLDLEVGIDVLV